MFHGYASGLYVSDNAVGLTLNNNRTEQHYDSGITLAKVIGATVVGGISAQNGWDTQGQVMTGESMAGVELRNSTRDVLITGNSFFGSIDKVQAYGVHMDSDAGVNTVGFNSMPQYIGTNIFNEATATKLVSNVFASGPNVTIGDYLLGTSYVPLTIRGGTSGAQLMEWDRTNGVVQKFGLRVDSTWMLTDRTELVDMGGFGTVANTMRRLYLGGNNAVASPKEGRVHAEDATGTDISGASVRIETGKGTGAGAVSAFYVDTPSLLSTGTTAQTLTTRLRVGESGVGLNRTTANSSDATLQIDSTTKGVLFPRMTTAQKNAIATPSEGLVVMDITLHKLQVYDGTSWVSLN